MKPILLERMKTGIYFTLRFINLNMTSISGAGNVQPVFNLDPCIMKNLWGDIVGSSIYSFLYVCVTRPPSPDLSPPDFFLWRFVKDQVYKAWFVIQNLCCCQHCHTRRAGSDGSMSGSAGPGFDPRWGSKLSFENFQPQG